MKKIILSAGFILAALTAQAQTCEAVATLSENFSDFTVGTTALPQNCWSAIAGGYPHGVVYADETTEPANKYAVYYGAGGNEAFSYLVGPEVSTFDSAHQLSFTTWKLAQGGTVPAGTVTIQVGTISNIVDSNTFVAFGEAIALSAEGAVTFDEIVIPSAPAGSHIAWRFSTANQHNAVAIDDVTWEAIPAPACNAVETINEDFTDFTQSVTLPFNCWSSIANGPMIYTGTSGGSITFYASTSAGVAAYLVSPEVSTFDGNHYLSFDARKSTGGVVTLQTGYLTNPTDATTFVTVGDAITLTGDVATYMVEYPELTGNAHIAFQYTGGSVHQAAVTDNVVWDAEAGTGSIIKNSFNLYPNPANGTVNIVVNGSEGTVSFYSITGNKVLESDVNGNSQSINISALSAGVYIVRCTVGAATTSQKLIVR
ncbi:T9SS type A sorting domain-containing protein [Flavobacterium sp. RHBU_24]|uniref:T9SS type A sorting domain-containing protein n=1 Tax=Flavobacterium sp. RHBU_24 TaxID=3391185 RepID=UPI003984DD71